ncbi:CHAT domain-containing protein [Kordia sp.]|uniref:CHAT domain-containing protein n=1 Tax=Kordia sp. TaxID=1965332 RepID=UPI003B59EA28
MSIPIRSNICSFQKRLLYIGILFYMLQGIAQTQIEITYDSIYNLSIPATEKIAIFKKVILPATADDKEAFANVCYRIAVLCYNADRKSGIPFLHKELSLRQQLEKPNKKLIAKAYYNLGNFYWFQRDYNNSLKYHDSLISYVTIPDKRCGIAYNTMARVYKNTGDYQRALDYFAQSEAILKKVKAPKSLLDTYINKLSLYVAQKYRITPTDFKTLENEVLQLVEEVNANDNQRLMILFNLGAILYTNQKNEASLAYYNQSLPIAEKLQDSLRIAQIYTNKALIHAKKGATGEAFSMNETALLFTKDEANQKSIIYDNLGDLYIASKQHKKALTYYNSAMNALLPFAWENNKNLPDYERIIASPEHTAIVSYLIDKQNGWLDFYDATQDKKYVLAAEQTLQLIDKIIDHLYFESKEKLSKLFWRKKGAKLYVNAVKICYLLEKPEQAFYYIEKNKGILLLDNISAFAAKRIAKLPQEVIDKEYALSKKVKDLEQKIISTTTSDSLKEHYFTAKESYYKYITEIEQTYPEYQRYRTSLPMLSVENVQKKLAENEVVIAYILGTEVGYVLLMNQKMKKIVPLNHLKQLKNRLFAFQKLYTKPFETTRDAANFQQLGNEIYQNLIPFQEDTIYSKATKLTIIPDGFIHALPFEILPINILESEQNSYLIEAKEISYRYSFSLDEKNNEQPSKDVSKSTAFMLANFQDSTLTRLTTNPTKLFNNATFINEHATKKSFLNAYNTSSQLYISTHAGNTNDVPWLAMFDEKVYPNELYFLNNPKALVVLNACKTSAGVFKEGEGVFSLTRGFLNSGSKSVVATLWNLNEKSGAEILKSFRSNIEASQSKSKALQNAKLAYLEKYKNTSQSSPYYWGGMILTGNTEAIPTPINIWKIIGLSMAAVIMIAFYLTYRKRSNINKSSENIKNSLDDFDLEEENSSFKNN